MNKFINIARVLAERSTYIYRLGAVAIKRNKVVGKGYNKLQKHPMLLNYGYYSIHAEADCLIKSSDMRGADTILVVRINKSGELTCGKPCERCIKFAERYGIKDIYYSDWDGEIKKMRIKL